jgi:hypothetical protein
MKAATWWVIFRILRWALWFASIAYYRYFWTDVDSHLDQFGHLTYRTEAFMFGLPLAAIFMGCFELMMRERGKAPTTNVQSRHAPAGLAEAKKRAWSKGPVLGPPKIE